ncbi:hypothetical protein HQ533_04630 [Candidatus Woesearchaeota archaeon]|nr:hypothetical protein [Candidatus Woesearchaeota archaeon]
MVTERYIGEHGRTKMFLSGFIVLLMLCLLVSVVSARPSQPGVSYIRGNNQLVAKVDVDNDAYLYQLDFQRNVRTLIKQDGDPSQPVALQEYYPYGKISSYQMDSIYKYKMLDFDEESQLYMGAYNPETARYIIPISHKSKFLPEKYTPYIKTTNPYRVKRAEELYPSSLAMDTPPALSSAPSPTQSSSVLPSHETGGAPHRDSPSTSVLAFAGIRLPYVPPKQVVSSTTGFTTPPVSVTPSSLPTVNEQPFGFGVKISGSPSGPFEARTISEGFGSWVEYDRFLDPDSITVHYRAGEVIGIYSREEVLGALNAEGTGYVHNKDATLRPGDVINTIPGEEALKLQDGEIMAYFDNLDALESKSSIKDSAKEACGLG